MFFLISLSTVNTNSGNKQLMDHSLHSIFLFVHFFQYNVCSLSVFKGEVLCKITFI